MLRIFAASVVLAAAGGFATSAHAIPWAEVGDAGDLPAIAQSTAGAGALDSITGLISSATDADMYRISSSGGAFSATTVGRPGTLSDTQLFLFNAADLGIVANDDSAGGLRSTITTTLAPGFYFVAISGFDRDPASAGGLIFPSSPFTGLFGPTGPGGGSPISNWTGAADGSGTYDIGLVGANFAVPEPGSLALLALALLGLGALRRRSS